MSVEETRMPLIEISKTSQGCEGKMRVPAITNGVLGKSVNPRRTEKTK
jgi:hypothetical protein